MLKKKNKVKTALFKVVLKKGLSYFNQNISLKIIKTADTKTKFGVSVSKKELKTAVKRNLLKRRAFSVLRKIEPQISPGLNCVFFLKKRALDLPYQTLQGEIIFLLKKANLIRL